MPEQLIGVPLGVPDDTTGGTSVEDFQLIMATMWSYWTKPDGTTTRAGIIRQSSGVELRPDDTLRVHQGSAVLDLGPNRVALVGIPYIASMPAGIAKGTAGRVTVYVAPPAAGSNNARVGTTTGTMPSSAVMLARLTFPAGWTQTRQATASPDRNYAILQGTTHGELLRVVDSSKAVRTSKIPYRACEGEFYVPTDSNINIRLSSTIRACNKAGTAGASASLDGVIYQVWLDGQLLTTVERDANGVSSTWEWDMPTKVLAGSHRVNIVSSHSADFTPGAFYWQVMQGGSRKHMGDVLRVMDEGVAR